MNARPSQAQGDRRFTLEATMAKVRAIAGVQTFDLDPCADHLSAWGKETYILLSDGLGDGLALPWHGHVFVNPPWSDIGPWVVKAWAEMLVGHAKSVTMLLPDNRQGTKWWQEQVEHARDMRGPVAYGTGLGVITLSTHYLPGRPRYGSPEDPQGLKAKSPPFGAVVLHFRCA